MVSMPTGPPLNRRMMADRISPDPAAQAPAGPPQGLQSLFRDFRVMTPSPRTWEKVLDPLQQPVGHQGRAAGAAAISIREASSASHPQQAGRASDDLGQLLVGVQLQIYR